MKRMIVRLNSVLLMIAMLVSIFSACTGGDQEKESNSSESESVSVSENTSDTEEKESSESETEDTSDTESEIDLNASNAEQILLANKLANGVQAYYSDAQRSSMVLENQEMSIDYGLVANKNQQVLALKNSKGVSYVENTMDVFLRMTDGNTYYASRSDKKATSNLYRIGYYYYESRYEGQDFYDVSQVEFTGEKRINYTKIKSLNQLEIVQNGASGLILKTTDNTDPFIIFDIAPFKTEQYGFLQITMKVDSENTDGNVFVVAGEAKSFTTEQSVSFTVVPDGEEHTYVIPLSQVPGYTGNVRGLRLDIGHGASSKESTIEISSMKLLQGESSMPQFASMNRSFLVYSDKMHQLVQIATTVATENVAEVGISTVIDADRVAKLIVKDASGEKMSIDGVDWASAEYVAFDIKDAGIFGYILPFDGKGGSIKVELVDEKYVIEQTKAPENNTLLPSEEKTDNANDFFMGSRVYTDENHDFTEFLYEAYCERTPLEERRFHITNNGDDSATYVGYDSLRGIYTISLIGNTGGFNNPYYLYPNRHFEAGFSIRGDNTDRKIYLMTTMEDGHLECAVLLDENFMALPVPLEVLKNFSEDEGERNLYNIDDSTYSEVILPLEVSANAKYEYMLTHLYQNWGNYPLKQLSGIQFRAPYYHLSTGITETNCIVPWYSTRSDASYNTLPDFRSMSAPFWTGQPQHNSCGDHYWLDYTDGDGNRIRSENIKNVITSYGPAYAEIEMDYISGDGKIAVKYSHMEMPQTDENRSYYTMEYTILEDVTIKDFKNDFSFYSVNSNDPTGLYKEVGYLNENNECTTALAKMGDETAQYVLGDKCPYFSFFNMNGKYDAETNPTGWSSTSQQGYSNVAFLVYSSSFVIGGKKCSPNFVLTDKDQTLYISLNLGEVTLKAGDKLTINAILLPWGSQELDNQYDAEGKLLTNKTYYDTIINAETGEAYKDRSVRNVREDTLLNPLVVEAVADCEVVESVYLPKVRTNNGKSAEFTLSGGKNNVAVRVYGFEKLTAPKVYEKIDGEWKKIELYSANNRDKMGYAYYYDGYAVYYDGDGTFSYSFVTTMDGENARTFKIEAYEDFERWPELEPVDQFSGDPLDIYYDATDLETSIGASGHASRVELIEENGENILRVYGNGERSESFIVPYFRINEDKVSGQYIVFKYRFPTSNTKNIGLEFWASTENEKPVAGDNVYVNENANDGEWHVIVIDVASRGIKTFNVNESNEYCASYLRVDYFNCEVDENTYIDIAYFGMCDTVEEFCELNKDMDVIRFIDKNEALIDPETGKAPGIGGDSSDTDNKGITMHMDASYIYDAAINTGNGVDEEKTVLSPDKSFTTIAVKDGNSECFIYLTRPKASMGRYAIIKYRMSGNQGFMQVYSSCVNSSAAKGDELNLRHETGAIVRDGEWHVAVVDLGAIGTYSASVADGKYYMQYFRIDPFNETMIGNGYSVDLAYVAFADDYSVAVGYDESVSTVQYFDGKAVTQVKKTPKGITLSMDAEYIFDKAAKAGTNVDMDRTILSADKSYVTVAMTEGKGECFITLANPNASVGRYAILKYRMNGKAGFMQIYSSTENTKAQAGDEIVLSVETGTVFRDEEWHIIVVDLAAIGSYIADENDGNYYMQYIRIDPFNTGVKEGLFSTDIAYVVLASDYDSAVAYDSESVSVIHFFDGETVTEIDRTQS